MSPLKINRAFAIAGIPNMPQTRSHILKNIEDSAPAEVLDSLTAKQLAALIAAANASYHDGRASKGDVELVDGDAVWVGHGVNKLIPLAALQSMQVTQDSSEVCFPADRRGPAIYWHKTKYMMDYTEKV